MTRYKTSLPMIDSDTGGLNFDGITSDGVGSGNLTVGNKLIIPSGASLSLASGANTALGSGAVASIGTNASLSLASGAIETVAGGGTVSLAWSSTLNAAGHFGIGAPGTSSVSVATASGTTVPVSAAIVRVSNTAASTSGSCTLAAGAFDGQQAWIINEGGANFVVTGNMKANQTLSASSAMALVWVSTDTAWWRVN